jgi:thymidylate synthase
MNQLDLQYQNLLKTILERGTIKEDRTGVGTKSIFGYTISHNMADGFPLLTTKKMYMKGIITELIWFLRGDTNIKYLIDNDCNIWNGDAYKNYCKNCVSNDFKIEEDGEMRLMTMDEFVLQFKLGDKVFINTWGDLGPIYGKQWRSWDSYDFVSDETHTYRIDQIANLINDLKTNPDSRRLMVNAWNPGEIDQMVLPPCHYGFQFWTRELTHEEKIQWVIKNTDVELENLHIVEEIAKPSIPKRAISLMWNQRSVDTFLGLPFNIASYGLLLEIVGRMVNMVPENLIGHLGDTHIYLNHEEAVLEQIERNSFSLPTLQHMKTGEFYQSLSENLSLFGHLDTNDFKINNYESHKTIKAQLNN